MYGLITYILRARILVVIQNKIQWHLNANIQMFFRENASKNVVYKGVSM